MKDSKAFLFSLYSNGRIDHMEKFEPVNNGKDLTIYYSEMEDIMIKLGDDIIIKNDWMRSGSYMNNEKSFDYKGYGNYSLCGTKFGECFGYEQMIIIEME